MSLLKNSIQAAGRSKNFRQLFYITESSKDNENVAEVHTLRHLKEVSVPAAARSSHSYMPFMACTWL